jgi:uncharacterized membrane protein
MPAEFTTLDVIAIGVFFATWVGYQALFEGRWRRPHSINALMGALRGQWMRNLLTRDNRIFDSQLVGLTIQSAAFFASTTMLVLAGLIGVLGSADRIYSAIANISLLLGGGQRLFEWKLVLLIGIFIYAFFKFTWALRQFNYFCAVIGSAPDGRKGDVDIDAYSLRMSSVMSHAVAELNAGVRAYYFAFAALGWFIHPVVFMVATGVMVLVIARRQLASPTQHAILEQVRCLPR